MVSDLERQHESSITSLINMFPNIDPNQIRALYNERRAEAEKTAKIKTMLPSILLSQIKDIIRQNEK